MFREKNNWQQLAKVARDFVQYTNKPIYSASTENGNLIKIRVRNVLFSGNFKCKLFSQKQKEHRENTMDISLLLFLNFFDFVGIIDTWSTKY